MHVKLVVETNGKTYEFDKHNLLDLITKYDLRQTFENNVEDILMPITWFKDEKIPIFTKDRSYIEKYLEVEE